MEPFCGGAGVSINLLYMDFVEKIIINDLDRSIYAFWYTIFNNTEDLIKKIFDTEINIENWKIMKEIQKNKENEPLFNLGFSTFFLNRTNRSGCFRSTPRGGLYQNGKSKINDHFDKKICIKKIEKIHEFKKRINLYNLSAEELITKNIKEKTFIFFDPPYFKKGYRLYQKYYKKNQHKDLKKIIEKNVKVPWLITYDNCKEIKDLYFNHTIKKYKTNHSIQITKKGTEIVIYSPTIKNKITPYTSEKKFKNLNKQQYLFKNI